MKQNNPAVNSAALPLSPSTSWSEKPDPDEQKIFEDFASRVIALQQRENAKPDGTLSRGFHAKLHAGLLAEFEVLPDLPEEARFGVFSEPRVFQALVRFSNGKPSHESDRGREPRGIGIKLIGVSGDKLPPGKKEDVTQDFLATSHSVTSTVRNAQQFIAFIEAGRKPGLMPLNLARAVGFGEARRILFALVRTVLLSRVRSMATEHYAGTAPIKLGPYAVKFTVRPSEGTRPPERRERTPDFLREELADRLREGDLLFDFVVQFYVNEDITPIEDTSVKWDSKKAPFVKLAQLRIPGCDLDDDETIELSRKIDQLAFSPWHTLEAHRPLGSVMRARRVAYGISADQRRHMPEPTGLPL